ncbi:MAG TPA: DUF3750 domain-containing protein [Candidatus Absconditabacterales bacterium]|nr:DUF3750 domain-containing protein [Candidatus Absconditabacterales bacterium]
MKKTFEQEIEKGKWMFFVYSTPLPFPFNFALHTWIVIISPDSEAHRYEIHMFKNKKHKEQGYFYKDDEILNVGLKKYLWKKEPKYDGKIIVKISGEKGSLAQKVVEFIQKNIESYKFKKKYLHIPGPNCNTLTQWILDKFPEIGIKLPWNAFGKNYKIKSE